MSESEAMASMAAMRLEDGRRWGEAAEPFQVDDARAVLDRAPTDPRLNWLGRSKGSSKSTDVAAMSMAWLLTQSEPLDEGYVVASDEEQAGRLLRMAARLIARTPGLSGQLEVQTKAIVHLRTGAQVIALAADVAGTEGILSPWLVLDELPNWADTYAARGMWTAIASSVPKMRSCRLTVIGHAGQPGSWQHKVFEAARKSKAWRVNDRPGPPPWIDGPELVEQRSLLLPFQFERRWQNRWADSDDMVAGFEELRRCVVLDGPQAPVPGVDYVVGVDLGVTGDRSVVAVCHAEPLDEATQSTARSLGVGTWASSRYSRPAPPQARRQRVVLDRLQVWRGSRREPVQLAEVGQWVLEASVVYNHAGAVFDPWQGIGLAQTLRGQGVRCDQYVFTTQSVGRLATVLFQLIRDGQLSLPDDARLLDELASVKIRETSTVGAVRMDHDSGKHDDQAVAIALAAQALVTSPVHSLPPVVRYRNGPSAGRAKH